MATLQINSKAGSYLIHGFVFVDQEKKMYGLRELSSGESRVMYGVPNREHFAQFGLHIENIDNSEVSARIERQNKSRLNKELSRFKRLNAALEIATDSCLSTDFGNQSDVKFKILKCQEKIESLSK